MIDINVVKDINKELTGHGDVLNGHLLDSVFSSYHYYDSLEDQLSSIYRGLIKNHAFRDGNKRTACSVLETLCIICGIKLKMSDSDMIDKTVLIAENNFSVEKISSMIFGIEESNMNIFQTLLDEALTDRKFNSTDEFIKAVKQVLRQSSIPKHITKSTKDKGFQETSRFGYTYSAINDNITISFFGIDKHDISSLARDLSNKDINYKYNDKTVQFLIKADDNVNPNALLSDEAKSELEDRIYDVIGTTIREKSKIKNMINNFNTTQNRIYQELLKFDLIEWKYLKADNGRFAYILLPKEDI